MNEDITINPERTNRGMQQVQREERYREPADNFHMGQQMQMNMRAAQGVPCPYCGTVLRHRPSLLLISINNYVIIW